MRQVDRLILYHRIADGIRLSFVDVVGIMFVIAARNAGHRTSAGELDIQDNIAGQTSPAQAETGTHGRDITTPIHIRCAEPDAVRVIPL